MIYGAVLLTIMTLILSEQLYGEFKSPRPLYMLGMLLIFYFNVVPARALYNRGNKKRGQ